MIINGERAKERMIIDERERINDLSFIEFWNDEREKWKRTMMTVEDLCISSVRCSLQENTTSYSEFLS